MLAQTPCPCNRKGTAKHLSKHDQKVLTFSYIPLSKLPGLLHNALLPHVTLNKVSNELLHAVIQLNVSYCFKISPWPYINFHTHL